MPSRIPPPAAPQDESKSDRAYRLLLRTLPGEFRGDYGSEMEAVFREQRAAAERRRGRFALFCLWWETILGMVTTAPAEHLAILNQDVRTAFRILRKEWGQTALAVIILALGIGANTSIFSVLNAILVRPLPYRHDGELLLMNQLATKTSIPEMFFSAPEIADYRARNHTFAGLAEYHSMTFTIFGKGDSQRVRTGIVSWNFFRLTGVRPRLGRDFRASDDQPGAPGVLLLSHEYWRQLGSDPHIAGKVVRMNDRDHTVIGVLPPLPQYPHENDIYMPTAACPVRSNPRFVADRTSRMMYLFGRLKPGVMPQQAREDLGAIARQIAAEHPDLYPAASGYQISANPLKEEMTRRARPMLWLLMGAASFVLLIACANVANLMLARLARRERELVVRSAFGAADGRILRQLLTESLMVAALAAGAGLLFAWGAMRVLIQLASRLTPRAQEISMNLPVLAYATGVAVLTSVVFGSLAAMHARRDIATGLKDGGAYSTWAPNRVRLRNTLVTCQIAFSFVLLIGAGLLMRSVANLEAVDPGFTPSSVLAVKVGLNWSRYNTDEEWRNAHRKLLEALRAEPGVVSAALSSNFPSDPELALYGIGPQRIFTRTRSDVIAALRCVSPAYFDTIGVPVLKGRAFTNADDESGPGVAIVSRSFARRYWAQEDDAIGKQISGDGKKWISVVGVAGDVMEFGPGRETPDEVYAPAAQVPRINTVLVRSTSEPAAAEEMMRSAIRELDPEIAITRVITLRDARDESIGLQRLTAFLLGLFALVALSIAVSGVGGILALSVSRRVHEIAIRITLGANPASVLGLIAGQGMRQVAIGMVAGVAGAIFLTGALQGLLFEVTPTDPLTFAAVAAVLALAALIACYIPARRATRVDPAVALRTV